MQTIVATTLSGHPVSTAASDKLAAGIVRSFYAGQKAEGQADSAELPAIVKPSTVVKLSKNAQTLREDEERFGRYQGRVSAFACSFLTRDDRRVIGKAYEAAENASRGNPEDSARMKQVDKLVGDLVAFRITQHSRGEVVRVAIRQALDAAKDDEEEEDNEDEPLRIEPEHLPLLGAALNGGSIM